MSSFGHGGHTRQLARLAGCETKDLLDFSANINPLGPPDCLRRVIARNLSAVMHYPDPHCLELREALATAYGVPLECVVVGNGSTEILHTLPRILGLKRAVIPVPSYIDYAEAANKAGVATETVELNATDGFSVDWRRIEPRLCGKEMLIIGQPGNPTGMLFDPEALTALADDHASSLFIVDEAFADFVEGCPSLLDKGRSNIIVVRSMTKFYAIPGLRLGYAVAPEALAQRLREALPPWSVGSLAQAVGVALLEDKAYGEKTRVEVARQREHLQQELSSLGGIRVFPSAANYLLARIDREELDAPELARRLLRKKIAIRVCDNYTGLDHRYFRVAVRTREENERLLDALAHALAVASPKARRRPVQHRPPAIMFQGTSSNAGKSVLAAACCRIFLQDGYRVAPFKAQNMSLNSYVTPDGGEIGRAQVVQAQACRLDPDVRMNPVLLKPNSATGSQVIVLGKPVENMDVTAYIRYKPQAFAVVKQAYDSLASEVDVVVLEGAGSPGEVNLKQHDIVNMAMAEYAAAPVLLIGDIDRGGVFASFVGTLEVLSERERNRIVGFIINRFRGQQALLGEAIEYTERHTGLPTFGVVPYIQELGIPEEDSVSFKAWKERDLQPTKTDRVDIAVIDLPHISNFTDFEPLKLERDVRLRIVRKLGELGQPDAIILPGSKNVSGDLAYLRNSGLAEQLVELAHLENTMLVGLCGGLQILGTEIADPYAIESEGGTQSGLNLLPINTVLAPEKTLIATHARHVESGLPLKGYEIHHGRTIATNGIRPAVIRNDGKEIGYCSANDRIFATYLHGLFDADGFRRWFIDRLRTRRGLPAVRALQTTYDIEPALERLAQLVRSHVDVKAIYQRMGLK